MTIGTADAALTQLRRRAAPRERRIAQALLLGAGVAVGVVVLFAFLRGGERWTEAVWPGIGAALSVPLGMMLMLRLFGPVRDIKGVTAMQKARLAGVRRRDLVIAVEGRSAVVPVELPRDRSLLRPGDRVWCPAPSGSTIGSPS